MSTAKPEETPLEKRSTRAAHVLASVGALIGTLLLVGAAGFLAEEEWGPEVVGGIALVCVFRAFSEHTYQLGDRLEQWLGWGSKDVQSSLLPGKSSDDIHWLGLTAMIINFMAFGGLLGLARYSPFLKSQFPSGTDQEKRIVWMSPEAFREQQQLRTATLNYWQTAVANLHAIRFETPSGQEPAEKYYEHMFQQLQSLTNTARSAPTTNVDADLVLMAMRHLAVEEQYLELKVKMDSLMQQEGLPSPKDSVDQRMELTQAILNLLATDPQAIEALPPGPVRDLVEKGLELEQTRQEQYREIEIMQATLQERYKGTAFPLPTINQP